VGRGNAVEEIEDGGDAAGDTPVAHLMGSAESAMGVWDHPSR